MLVEATCIICFVAMAAIPALNLTEGLWFKHDRRPMLEQIEEARANAVYNMYEEAEFTGQYEFL